MSYYTGEKKLFNLSVALVGVLAVNLFTTSLKYLGDPVLSKTPAAATQATTWLIYTCFLFSFIYFTLLQQEYTASPLFFGTFISMALIILGSMQLSTANKGIQVGTAVVSTTAGDRSYVPQMKKDTLGLVGGSLNLIMGVTIGGLVLRAGFSG